MSVRWFARIAAPLAVACVGTAFAQSPTASATPAALAHSRSDNSIVLMRTAGQPDRQLEVLKLSKYPDGESVAEVQDVESGQFFTLPGQVVAMLPKSLSGQLVAAAPPVIAPPTVTMKPITPQPVKPNPTPIAKPDDGPTPKVIPIPAPTVVPVAVQPPEIKPVAESTTPAPTPAASLVWRPRNQPAPPIAPEVAPVTDRWQPSGRGPTTK